MHLTATDYAVTIILLLTPVGIGIFFAWKDARNVNREEYLLGGRTMSMVPVVLSMLVTFQSAVGLLGFTSDTYMYGIMIVVKYVGSSWSSVLAAYTMVPLLHPLKMTSLFDYLEMRYKSRAVRMFTTVIGMLATFFYMVISLMAPGLALQTAVDIPFWMSVAVVGGIGTLYTAVGGFKSVIWTDVFQTFIMIGGLLLLIIKGTVEVGGAQRVWTLAEEGARTNMNQFSPDPRTRHTWWGMLIGGAAIWQSYQYTQSNFQRIASVQSLETARKSVLLTSPLLLIYGALIGAVGILSYSYFHHIRCDPLEGGMISNMNQVSVYFMLHVFQDWPGLAGLYMATLFSGALSTLSSGINALAANSVEDVLAFWLRDVSERTATIVTKITVLFYGVAIIGLAYLAKSLSGPVTQMSGSVAGSFGGVVVGIFLAGCTVPWANKYGVLVGGLLTMALNLWLVIGSRLNGRKSPPLPSAPTDQCPPAAYDIASCNSTSFPSVWNDTFSSVTTVSMSADADDPYQYGFFFYDISYEWYALIGIGVCCTSILIASKLASRYFNVKDQPDARLILPCLRKFWRLEVLPEKGETELDSLHV